MPPRRPPHRFLIDPGRRRAAGPAARPGPPRTALEYLAAWRELFALQVQGAVGAENAAPRRAPADPAEATAEVLLEGLDEFERGHPGASVVTLAHDAGVTAADLAILHVLALDAQSSEPGEQGFLLPALANEACGSRNNTFALERLTPESPVFARGFARVQDPDDGFLDRIVLPEPALLRLVWEGRGPLEHQVSTVQAIDGPFGRRPGPAGHGHGAPDDDGDAARPVETVGAFVLPPAVERQFHQVVLAVKCGQALRERYGFQTTMPTGRSSSVLFLGPPGTGKTTACRALAHALGRPMRILSAGDVLDRWVGESEKRLTRAFAHAEQEGAVLVLDEIDALAYARAGATHTHQRTLVTHLLMLVERHPSLVLAGTCNEAEALDPALERRMAFRIEVPMPGPEERLRLWRALIPADLPLADDADLDRLAREHELSGALIRDAVWHAALAMEDRGGGALSAGDLRAGLEVVQAGRWTTPDADEGVGFRAGCA